MAFTQVRQASQASMRMCGNSSLGWMRRLCAAQAGQVSGAISCQAWQ